MGEIDHLLGRLQDFTVPQKPGASLEDSLQRLAATSARALNAENCSIMLLEQDEIEDLRLRVCANFGKLSAKAYNESVMQGEGIAGYVAATGHGLLIEDIEKSPFAGKARHPDDPRKSMISSPIVTDGHIHGVINVNGPKRKATFDLNDLAMLDILALFVGKSIQVIQLQNVLNSRFAQHALLEHQQADKAVGDMMLRAAQKPDQMARLMARTFFRELTKAGFGSGQIINVASEIISELSKSLQKRQAQEGEQP
ncbi:MAG: GAF domain-containing protein [Betaproteobacteria bacterium]|nr:GAF domain-containing protein [Betaproteobacteria bacterium]